MGNNVFLCGGDLRSVYMAKYFAEKGFNVQTYGHESFCESDIKKASEADIIVMGLPATKNGMINMPLCRAEVEFTKLINECAEGAFIAGGRFLPEEISAAAQRGITVVDYSEDEIFQVENAFYTAEGAISALISATEKSLCDLNILVVGYGRIAKAFCLLLSAAPCRISVCARNDVQRAWCNSRGMQTHASLGELGEYDAVINTVPAHIFSGESMATLKKDSVIIDLSARPGYVDKELCNNLGIKLMYLPGLPLTSAPRSAGEAAARAVMRNFFTEGK